MKYITVGTREISKNSFRKITDRDNEVMKPLGGMWFSEFDSSSKRNVWVDFILDNPHLLFYKNKSENIWEQPCSIATLNDNANILCLENFQMFKYLTEKFPYDGNKFSYEKLCNCYDGIYVDVWKLFKERMEPAVFNMIRQFGVSSLVLFNLECIDYYQSGIVNISPFDFEYHRYADITYEIECEKVKKRVLN